MDDDKFDWHSMSDEEKQAFIRESAERRHKERYQWALEYFNTTGPAWEDLTEEQRERIRETNRQYDREMQAFGESLRSK